MPSVTLSVEADVATRSDSAIAAGAGPHLPVGSWSGADYRSAIRFPRPAWGAWVSITKATLSFYISDHAHVGVKNSSIYVRRNDIGDAWTKAEGTQDCNAGFSGSNNTQFADLNAASTNQVSFSSGTTANAKKSVVVTAMVRDYFENNQHLVFIFDNVGSSDYTELWSDEKTGGFNAELVIEYTDAVAPLAPTLDAPIGGAVLDDTTPNFSWTHNDPNAQNAAQVELYQNDGTTLINTYTVAGAANNVNGTDVLSHGLGYKWRARTSDAGSGYGAWSAQAAFTMRPAPVVTVSAVRRMVFNGEPRLVVEWSSDQPQAGYQVTAPGYDSGYVPGGATSHVLSTLALASGTPVTVTVGVVSTYGSSGADSETFTPRWGLTTHRRDLTAAPLNWGSPAIVSTVPPDTQLVIEYGSDVAAIGAPSAWFSSLSAVPKKRYLFWRAWFIPSATQGPTLDVITIPTDAAVVAVDKWSTVRDGLPLAAPWGIDPGEAVYGTRSMTIDCDGTERTVYSYGIKVRAERSYILTGLMKSQGDSGAHFRLEDTSGNILQGGGMVAPPGPVESTVLHETLDWFDTASRDVNRYRTVVWVAPADMTVYVVLAAQGVAGAKAWWDAVKLEESTVATPWSPGAIGATVIDAGGVQVDGARGGVLRYKGVTGGARDTVIGGPKGLVFGGDTELYSPIAKHLHVGSSGSGDALEIGNDAKLLDVDLVHTLGLQSQSDPAQGVLVFGDGKDTNIYRGAANVLATDDSLSVAGYLAMYGPVLLHNGFLRAGGTAFPGGPVTGDRYWRTDLRMEFFWDGTRWLSTELLSVQFELHNPGSFPPFANATSNTAIKRALTPWLAGGSDIWLETWRTIYYITAGTALSGANSWAVTLQKSVANAAVTTLATLTVNSGSRDQFRKSEVALNQLLNAGVEHFAFSENLTKVGTPGTWQHFSTIAYRIVAT